MHSGRETTLDYADQGWTLDPTGTLSGYVTKAAGSQTLKQTRTSNKVNETTGIGETVGPSWVDPAYDEAGNMTTGPVGTTPITKLHFVFDAWNRMVAVKADSSGSPGTTIASYAYDGRNRRITKTIGGHTYHGYYNNNWQYLETRLDTATTSSGQIVWDLRYIDSPLALLGGVNPLYYTNDANFNVTSLINGSTVRCPSARNTILTATCSSIRPAGQLRPVRRRIIPSFTPDTPSIAKMGCI